MAGAAALAAASPGAAHAASTQADPARGEAILLFTTDSGLTREQLQAASEQFEAMFLQQILKQMRKAGDVLYIPKGSAIEFGTTSKVRFFYVTYPANWQG